LGTETPIEYTIDLSKAEGDGLFAALDYAKEKYGLAYSYSGEGTSAYLEQVGDLKNDSSAGVYIYVYTSVDKDFDVSEYATTIEYKGQTLHSSGVGAYSMTLEDGAVIYIGTIKY
jgi:hypothetical protein